MENDNQKKFAYYEEPKPLNFESKLKKKSNLVKFLIVGIGVAFIVVAIVLFILNHK